MITHDNSINFTWSTKLVSTSSLGLSLASTEHLLATVLLLGTLGLGHLVDLGSKSVSDKTVTGLELLEGLSRVVDESESSGLSTSVLSSQTEHRDSVLLGLVDGSELFSELVLGDVSPVRVENVDHKLASGQQRVSDELSGSDSDGVALTLVHSIFQYALSALLTIFVVC